MTFYHNNNILLTNDHIFAWLVFPKNFYFIQIIILFYTKLFIILFYTKFKIISEYQIS